VTEPAHAASRRARGASPAGGRVLPFVLRSQARRLGDRAPGLLPVAPEQNFRPVRLVAGNLARLGRPCFTVRMSRNATEAPRLVQIEGRTFRIRTQVVVEEVDGEGAAETTEVIQREDGSFEMMLAGADATSIDKSERAILDTAYPAIRQALSQHLSSVSQKKLNSL